MHSPSLSVTLLSRVCSASYRAISAADDYSQDHNGGLHSTKTSTRRVLGGSALPSSENGAYQLLTLPLLRTVKEAVQGSNTGRDDRNVDRLTLWRVMVPQENVDATPDNMSRDNDSNMTTDAIQPDVAPTKFGSLSSGPTHAGDEEAIVVVGMAVAEEMMAFHLVVDILGATDLHPIIAAAWHDHDIRPYRLRHDLQHSFESFGQSLLPEVRDRIGKKVSVALERALSSKLVASFAFGAEAINSSLMAERAEKYRITKRVYEVTIEDDTSALGESDTTGRYDPVDIKSLIRSSSAYCTYKKDLLNLARRPHEARVLRSLVMGSSVIGGSGKVIEGRGIAAVAEEISWIPTTLFRWSHREDLSFVDRLKGFVEDSMGETWNWWPLRPRVRRLSDGFCRLSWQTVCPLLVKFQD
jgi:hypothetical protein